MIATKLWRRPWKVMSSRPAARTAGRSARLPKARKRGPPLGEVNKSASPCGFTNRSRWTTIRRITDLATGTLRFDRVVLGWLSRVTLPLTSTAVWVTRIRLRPVSMSQRRSPTASRHRSPAYAPMRINAAYSAGMAATSRSTSACDR
jgi:hypothetical protein